MDGQLPMEPSTCATALITPLGRVEPSVMREGYLRRAVEHAAHLLPAQGPIGVFVHHNTLHAMEHLPFHDAVQHAARLYGCQPYLSDARYREELSRGRIRDSDLVRILEEELGDEADEPVLSLGTWLGLRLAMMRFPLWAAPAVELRWFVANTDALKRFREDVPTEARQRLIEDTRRWVKQSLDRRHGQASGHHNGKRGKRAGGGGFARVKAVAGLLAEFRQKVGSPDVWSELQWQTFALRALWQVCRAGVRVAKYKGQPLPARVRHRDILLEATGEDSDALVHPLLIRFCAAQLDQGFSHWQLPYRQLGFFRAFCRLYGQRGGPPDVWLRGLAVQLRRLDEAKTTPVQSILESLDALGVPPLEWENFISATFFVLRGWAGMVYQLEVRGDRAILPAPDGSLLELLAVRLIVERFALLHVARRTLAFRGPLSRLRRVARAACSQEPLRSLDERAFAVFQLAQWMGWSAAELSRLTPAQWTTLESAIEGFPELERRRIFHLAYERRFRIHVLDALSAGGFGADIFLAHAAGSLGRDSQTSAVPQATSSPSFQAIFCIDEREESIRRHLEEVIPDVETFGAAGFFGVAMYYRGVGDAHAVPLCPVAIKPQHYVEEEVVEDLQLVHRRRMEARRVLGRAKHWLHIGSRMGALGALVTATLGVFASLPLVARVLFPWSTGWLRRSAGRMIRSNRTRLRLEAVLSADAARSSTQVQRGFTVAEMTGIVERLLRDIGMTSSFSRLVFVVGHGSSSLNNPHESAHDCGACGGGRGGPNARALAQMANDPRIRWCLGERGIHVPADCVFVGAFHNSCDDSLEFLDLDNLPQTHKDDFQAARAALQEACDHNAHERCRRFTSAPLDITPHTARRHVEARAEDLAQTRPEYGHATNAVCIVGRRRRTRGLFLDRRAFLASYDPAQDDAAGTILARILQAVGPVCAGINLEYYFSFVDPTGYGCGTKLPHNITSLLGVMDGHASDLRTGLPWQMVEIHEPVRLLLVVESRPDVVLGILEQNESLRRMCGNEWIQLAALDPESSEICVFSDGRFSRYDVESRMLPVAPTSADWYRGQCEHLGFARIGHGSAKE